MSEFLRDRRDAGEDIVTTMFVSDDMGASGCGYFLGGLYRSRAGMYENSSWDASTRKVVFVLALI